MSLMQPEDHPLARLFVADPDLGAHISTLLDGAPDPVPQNDLSLLVNETLWALSQEITFGKTVGMGYAQLLAVQNRGIQTYQSIVREAGKNGPTLGKLMAKHLVPVLTSADKGLLDAFLTTCSIMRRKGTYTLKGPLEGLSRLLAEGDIAGGRVYIDLLCHAYDRELSYQQSLQMTYTIPKAVRDMPVLKRIWQMSALSRIIQRDISAADCFVTGLNRGLRLLHKKGLHHFVAMGLERFTHDKERGCRFLSLETRLSLETCLAMQVAVPLSQIRQNLYRYVRTRIGRAMAIRSNHGVHAPAGEEETRTITVFSDEEAIYLPSEIDVFDSKKKNQDLYKSLVKLESAHLEFGTYEFDAERALDRSGVCLDANDANSSKERALLAATGMSEIERFLHLFDNPALAADLFVIYEHGRICWHLRQLYPGIANRTLPVMQQEMLRVCHESSEGHILNLLYAGIALGIPKEDLASVHPPSNTRIQAIQTLVETRIENDPVVETCGRLLLLTYEDIVRALVQDPLSKGGATGRRVLKTPFGRGLKPDLRFHMNTQVDHTAATIQSNLRDKGLKVYRRDVQKKLTDNNGVLSEGDLQQLIVQGLWHGKAGQDPTDKTPVDLSGVDFSDVCSVIQDVGEQETCSTGTDFFYHEWDDGLGDYLADHVRVVDRKVHGLDGDFYGVTLERYHGLVQHTRRAFERLRPQGLSIMRPWIEGDQFDYGALMAFALDRKTGRIPSDRLYIKRDKRQRDVAVLVLVDLSKSTANFASGSSSRILDIEKEALVLLSEALDVTGDQFALAGFSGAGRSHVDYLRIKDFSDGLDEDVHQRINAVAPLRSTRMGAAIRHATQDLSKIPAKVRLLLTLTDGFPNDAGYKQGYAVADTRKAVFEAHAKQIHFKAIVVNLAGDPNLDALYGKFQHSLISNTKELPNKLLRIYGAMTRM
jgi:nitric oxide reductase NorD protein